MITLATTGDTEMITLVRRFTARLERMLTPTEIETYARYVLMSGRQRERVPASITEQIVCLKILANPTATALSNQIVAGLMTRKQGVQGAFGRN